MKKIIKFDRRFYSKEILIKSLEEFEDVCQGIFLDEEFNLELIIDADYDLANVVGELRNLALSLMKSKMSLVEENKNEIQLKSFEFEGTNYDYNFYRYKKLEDKFLLVTETSDYIFLEEDEFNIFQSANFGDNLDLLELLVEKNFLFRNKNYSKLVKKKRDKLSFLFQGPSLHIVVVTLRCNLRCSYCHASSVPMNKKGFDMDEEVARKTINKIFESPSQAITIEFQGGEPLLNFEIIKYMILYAVEKNKVIKKDLRFDLVSNLVYMTDDILDFLIEYNVGICTSLDGPREIHNKNRQEYVKTTSWIKKINQIYMDKKLNKKINALPVITKFSLDKYKEIVDEYISLNFDSIFLRQLNPLGFANYDKNIFYNPEEYFIFWKNLLEYLFELNKKGIKISEHFTRIILQKILLDADPNYCELRSPCGAVNGQLLYNYNGDVYSCDEGRMLKEDLFKLGTVDDSYEYLTTNPTSCSIMASSINDVHYCDKCVYKTYCGICPVLNYTLSNSVISNINSQDRCKILKSQFDYIFEKLASDKEVRGILLNWV